MSNVNSELQMLSSWFKSNKLSLNIKKTNYIIFGNIKILNNNFNIILDGNTLTRVKTTTFLSVQIDEKLNWQPHILSTAKRFQEI